MLVARRRDRLEALRAELQSAYPRLNVYLAPYDLADPAAVEALLADVAQAVDPIDILINNAGVGDQLYTSNTANNSLSEYAVNTDGSLALVSNTQLKLSGTSPTVTNTRPIDLRLSPDGRYLYVIKAGVNTVGELAVNADGSLTELSAAPVALPAGVIGFASGIVVD